MKLNAGQTRAGRWCMQKMMYVVMDRAMQLKAEGLATSSGKIPWNSQSQESSGRPRHIQTHSAARTHLAVISTILNQMRKTQNCQRNLHENGGMQPRYSLRDPTIIFPSLELLQSQDQGLKCHHDKV